MLKAMVENRILEPTPGKREMSILHEAARLASNLMILVPYRTVYGKFYNKTFFQRVF